MIDAITLTIRGTPQPQPRPRFVHGRVISTVSKPVKLWRAFVVRAAREAMAAHGWRIGDPPLMTGPVRLDAVFTFEAPASHPERIGQPHTHKPDFDNIAKAAADALQDAKLIGDDARISVFTGQKVWGASASTVVVLRSIEPRAVVEPRGAPAWLAGE